MKIFKILPILFCSFILASCGEITSQKELFAMDTVINITVTAKNSKKIVHDLEQTIFELNEKLSRKGGSKSDIFSFNTDKAHTLSGHAFKAVQAAYDMSIKTKGYFDFTIAPLTDLWGFYDKNYRVPSDDDISKALENIGYDKVYNDGNKIELNGTQIDIDGIAKGYATDVLVDNLKSANVKSALLSLGGNMYAFGKKPNNSDWKVGIADPKNPSESIGVLSVCNKAVVTSGIYQRYFEENGVLYHHILNPFTGKNPENNLASVTVIGNSAAECDALSTAFFVMGIDKTLEYLEKESNIDVIFVDKDGKISITSDILEYFETDRAFEILN